MLSSWEKWGIHTCQPWKENTVRVKCWMGMGMGLMLQRVIWTVFPFLCWLVHILHFSLLHCIQSLSWQTTEQNFIGYYWLGKTHQLPAQKHPEYTKKNQNTGGGYGIWGLGLGLDWITVFPDRRCYTHTTSLIVCQIERQPVRYRQCLLIFWGHYCHWIDPESGKLCKTHTIILVPVKHIDLTNKLRFKWTESEVEMKVFLTVVKLMNTFMSCSLCSLEAMVSQAVLGLLETSRRLWSSELIQDTRSEIRPTNDCLLSYSQTIKCWWQY